MNKILCDKRAWCKQLCGLLDLSHLNNSFKSDMLFSVCVCVCEDTFCVKEHLLCESEQRISVRDSPERQHCPSIVFNCSNNKPSLLLSVLCVPPQIQTDRQTRALHVSYWHACMQLVI